MRSYILLRNNEQTGPYTLAELDKMKLQQNDLIWVENVSTAWKYPIELSELNPLMKLTPKPPKHIQSAPKSVFVSYPVSESDDEIINEDEPQLETKYSTPLSRLKSNYNNYLTSSTNGFKKVLFYNKASQPIALFFITAVSIFLLKNILDGFAANRQAHKQSVIKAISVNALPENVTNDIAEPEYQNALVTEVNVVQDSIVQEDNADDERAKKPASYHKMIEIENSAYTVKPLGGINTFTITISNKSLYTVDAITLEVDFLKENGKVVLTEDYESFNIKPAASKTIYIPQTKKGVKVMYRIKKIMSKGYSTTLLHV